MGQDWGNFHVFMIIPNVRMPQVSYVWEESIHLSKSVTNVLKHMTV